MDEEKKTGCICENPGFCPLHAIKKSAHFHKLCQNHPGYFQMWEECKGPGQSFTDCSSRVEVPADAPAAPAAAPDVATAVAPAPATCGQCKRGGCSGNCSVPQLPSKIQMAKNLAHAITEHAKTGFANVEKPLQEQRLEICKGCEFYMAKEDRCAKCGCHLKSKSAWKSSHCPIGKW